MDETSFGRHGRVVYGYSPRGEQLKIQRKTSRMTIVSSLTVVSDKEIIHRQEVKGSFNTLLFCSFLESLSLPVGTVILLDNVAFHRSKKASEVANLKGYIFLFTPPYSPWFNPIEGVFSIVKRDFYKHGSIVHPLGPSIRFCNRESLQGVLREINRVDVKNDLNRSIY